MKVKYIGRNASVKIPDLNVSVALEEVIEVSDEMGALMLKQVANWAQVEEAPPVPFDIEDPVETEENDK